MSEINEILTRLTPGKFDATRAANFDVERAKGVLASEFPVERILNFNAEERTANFAFASDQPIEHWFGYVILNTEKKNVDLSRVEKGVCPFLVNHRTDQQCGVVVPGSVELGPVIRGKVKFSRSSLGEEILNDVKDEIRNGTSLGFLVRDLVLVSNNKDEIPIYEATKWTMLENSSASIPADYEKVGAGRSFEDPKQISVIDRKERTQKMSEPNETPSGTTELVTRTQEIVDFAAIFGEAEMARTMISASPAVTLDDVRVAIRSKQTPAPAAHQLMDPADQAFRQGGARTELARSVARHGAVRNFSGEGADQKAYRFGQWIIGGPGGNPVARQWCLENGLLGRGMNESSNTHGGFLVPEEFGNDLIDLVEKHGVFRRNAMIKPMSSDARSDPRVSNELEAEFVGESSSGTDQEAEYDRIALIARKVMVTIPYSSELSEDSAIAIGDQLAGLSARAFSRKEDQCGFNGDATSTYGGIVGVREKLKGLDSTIAYIAGLQVGTGNLYSELTLADFRGVVARLPQYADSEAAAWYCSRSFYWNTMVGALLASGGVTAAEVEAQRTERFLGYRVEFTQVMPTVEANSQVCAVLGDLSMGATFGDRRSIRIQIGDQVRFREDDLVFKATERFDINVHDVGNASATAGLRVPGPIVGLITAAA